MSVPAIGQSYRGVEGYTGYLLGQAWRAQLRAMAMALRAHGLTPWQYGVLSVLAREPGASGADLARATHTTPQAMSGVLGDARTRVPDRAPPPSDAWPSPPSDADERGPTAARGRKPGRSSALAGDRAGPEHGRNRARQDLARYECATARTGRRIMSRVTSTAPPVVPITAIVSARSGSDRAPGSLGRTASPRRGQRLSVGEDPGPPR